MSSLSDVQLRNHAKARGYAILKLSFNDEVDESFKTESRAAFDKHNKNILTSNYPDSGVDLRVPEDTHLNVPFRSVFVNLGVKVSMSFENRPVGFNMHPRSSISKTPLMLANHTGIIDSGYRGSLIAAMRLLPFDNVNTYTIEKNSRIMQICHPSLCPVFVVECSESDLSRTERGGGGFGSTGK
jgi:dUTP pyrophosphatase